MKKISTIILSTILFLSLTTTAHAAAATATPKISPTTAEKQANDDKLNKQINQLKEKIASRVAELNLVEKRGIIGTVTEVSGNQITLTDMDGKTRFIDVDEITKFSATGDKNFGLSDIKKGSKISVLGLYNKQSKRILGRFISLVTMPTLLSGAIAQIDSKNFMITVASENDKQTKIDIQTSTKILTRNGDSELIKYGFSKLKIGDRVFVFGAPDKKDTTLFVAVRLIALPDAPKDPNIALDQPQANVTDAVKPSSGSGKKLTPIR